MKQTRRQSTVGDKVKILRLHLLEQEPISDLCDQYGLHPTVFYGWQKEFFEHGTAAFERSIASMAVA
jgi:transposase-like protein